MTDFDLRANVSFPETFTATRGEEIKMIPERNINASSLHSRPCLIQTGSDFAQGTFTRLAARRQS